MARPDTSWKRALLGLRTTAGACIAGAIGAALCTASGGTLPAGVLIAIGALMNQAASYGINRLSSHADKVQAELDRQAVPVHRAPYLSSSLHLRTIDFSPTNRRGLQSYSLTAHSTPHARSQPLPRTGLRQLNPELTPESAFAAVS